MIFSNFYIIYSQLNLSLSVLSSICFPFAKLFASYVAPLSEAVEQQTHFERLYPH